MNFFSLKKVYRQIYESGVKKIYESGVKNVFLITF